MNRFPVVMVAVTAIAFFTAFVSVLPAQSSEDFSIHVAPVLELPLGSRSSLVNDGAAYGLGGSASLTGQYIFPSFPLMYLGGGLGYQMTSTPGTAPTLNIASVGMETGANLRLGNTLSLQTGLEAGLYVGFFGESVGSNPFIGATTRLGWDLSPGFSISAGLGYRYHVALDA